jgi:hypothetical protein
VEHEKLARLNWRRRTWPQQGLWEESSIPQVKVEEPLIIKNQQGHRGAVRGGQNELPQMTDPTPLPQFCGWFRRFPQPGRVDWHSTQER